jgi:hypothetical protein
MSTIGGVPRRGLSDLVSAVIEEAWRRARRRRLIYAGIVLALAVIGAVVTATLRGPSPSSSTSAIAGSPSTPVTGVPVSARAPHHYHLYPGDTVDVGGGPHFDWSCTLYRLGPTMRHAVGARTFECRGGAEWTRAKPHFLLRVVVFQEALFVQRGHKTVYGVDR